jgi:uncharacterized membrane protein YcfT
MSTSLATKISRWTAADWDYSAPRFPVPVKYESWEQAFNDRTDSITITRYDRKGNLR